MPIPQPVLPTQLTQVEETDVLHSQCYTLRQPLTRRPRRKMFRRLPTCAVPGYSPLCLDSNDPQTIQDSIYQRLLRDLPSPNPEVLLRFKAFVEKFLSENVPRVTPLTFEEWLSSTTYDIARKNQLRESYASLRGGRPTRKQCEKIQSFIKTESYPTWKQARTINSRADVFKAWSGPMFKAIENAIYTLPEFIKHTPVPERPAKIRALRKANRRYFQTDFTAFESHFCWQFLKVCECALYRHCLASTQDADFLCSVISGENHLSYRAGVKAKLIARRMSGDMCTSLGNGFTNLMLAKFIVECKGSFLEGFVEGDDGLFSTEVELTSKDYADLGFTIKVEEVVDPCAASFCGMIFPDSGEIIRDPRKFIQNFGWTHSFIHAGPEIMNQLLRAKALSACFETPQCPIVGAFARKALYDTCGCTPRFVHDGYHTAIPDAISVPPFRPSDDTRVLFAQEFGVSPDLQKAVEAAVEDGDMDLVASLLPPSQEVADYTRRYVVIT